MDVLEFTPTPEQYAYTFGGAAPALRIPPGAALRLWSDDAFGGVLRSVDDLSSDKVDLRFVNPQTGPFYVEGAEPGDTLVLHLVDLEPARDWGASATIPFFGGMTSTDRTVTLQDALPDTTWIYQVDRARNTVAFAARHSDHRIELPSRRCSARSGWPRPAARSARRWCPTGSAATWTPRRCAPAPRSTSASMSRARCSPSATGTTARARGRPAARPSRAR